MQLAKIIQEKIVRVVVKCRNVEPVHRCQYLHLSHVIAPSLPEFEINLLAIHKYVWPQYVASHIFFPRIDGKKIVVDDAVIDGEIVIELRKIVVPVPDIKEGAKILSPINETIATLGLHDIIQYEITMKTRWYSTRQPVEIDT